MAKHSNNGACEKCAELFERYHDFYQPLREWFEQFQEFHPEAHISCAGRGEIEQESMFQEKRSRAHYGESPHNFNAAIDVFCIVPGIDIYDREWFERVLAPIIPSHFEWGGSWKKFPDYPHIQVRNWILLRDKGLLYLVEDMDGAA